MKKSSVLVVALICLLGSGCCDHKKQMREIKSEIMATEIEITRLKLDINQKEVIELTNRLEKLP